jgi:hypothetical protein
MGYTKSIGVQFYVYYKKQFDQVFIADRFGRYVRFYPDSINPEDCIFFSVTGYVKKSDVFICRL